MIQVDAEQIGGQEDLVAAMDWEQLGVGVNSMLVDWSGLDSLRRQDVGSAGYRTHDQSYDRLAQT